MGETEQAAARVASEGTPGRSVSVNGRAYAWPAQPTVVVCFDGCDPAYVAAARAAGVVPTLER
ncbi:MAG: hypothetical protein B7X67_27095, partial [Rhizobiales bacterium 39-66-18]